MEEQFEEFEEETEEIEEIEDEPVKKPKTMVRTQPPLPPQKKMLQQPVRKPVAQQQQPREEEEKEVPQQQPAITGEDLIAAIQNHEQRLVALESAFFRLRGAI